MKMKRTTIESATNRRIVSGLICGCQVHIEPMKNMRR